MKIHNRTRSLALLLASAVLALASPADAASPAPASKPSPHGTSTPRVTVTETPARSDAPAGLASSFAGFDHIQAAHLSYNFQSGNYTIPERFTATRSGTEITADKANGNSKKKVMHAEGSVVVHQTQPLKSGGDVTKVTQEPSTLTCDKLDADGLRKLYTAAGNVHFTQANREGSSDVATLDDNTHMLHMEGHVHLRDKEQFLDGDVVDYNTVTGQAEVGGKPHVLVRFPVETPSPGPPKTPAPKKKGRLF